MEPDTGEGSPTEPFRHEATGQLGHEGFTLVRVYIGGTLVGFGFPGTPELGSELIGRISEPARSTDRLVGN
ncbi:hypothetical protein GCM10010357_33540 [Streptomyces luteireticuli]|uniref:Uncharacterized protein n=1 Tax=Streptomyces luteireticuli TaxID=173858 RepID=A0ABN0YTH1_9ACTN